MASRSKRFFVIDGNGYTSYNEKKDAPEVFRTAAAAGKRAREMATENPGTEVFVCVPMAVVTAPIGAVKMVSMALKK